MNTDKKIMFIELIIMLSAFLLILLLYYLGGIKHINLNEIETANSILIHV
jgi:hypothetical protein